VSAELLRRAAKEMRERAEAASPGPWYLRENDLIGGMCVMPVDVPPSSGVAEVSDFGRVDDARYIASWHPAVALAVADWLDEIAFVHPASNYDQCDLCTDDKPCECSCAALKVARAYLGEAS
jgi:hypothetical protein